MKRNALVGRYLPLNCKTLPYASGEEKDAHALFFWFAACISSSIFYSPNIPGLLVLVRRYRASRQRSFLCDQYSNAVFRRTNSCYLLMGTLDFLPFILVVLVICYDSMQDHTSCTVPILLCIEGFLLLALRMRHIWCSNHATEADMRWAFRTRHVFPTYSSLHAHNGPDRIWLRANDCELTNA